MTAPRFWLAALAAGVVLFPQAKLLAAPDTAADVATPHYGTWGYDPTGEDTKVSPGADFFDYANGAWYARTQIPADRVRFGNFDRLNVLSENRVRLIMEQAAAGQSTDPDAQRIGAAYRAFMDEALVNKLDAAPLGPDLAAIRAEQSKEDVARQMGQAAYGMQSAIFSLGIDADAKDPNRYTVYMDARGLGLPDRDYYLKPDFAQKKADYQAYVTKLLGAIGWADPAASAAAVVDFEGKLADAEWPRADRRNPDKTYNPTTVEGLATYAPGFDFRTFLSSAGLGSRQTVVLVSNTAFPKYGQIFQAAPLETLKAWQAFHLVDNAAPMLSDRFVQARFAFRNHDLAGQPELQPRWKRGVAFVDGAVGEAVGRLYVARYFTPEAKAKIDDLVNNLKLALHDRIEHATWMSPETKAKAELKLSKFTVKIGYPVKWIDYSTLVMKPDDLYGDAVRATAFEWNREVKRIDEPVDKLEWGMTPQTVNAYYNPSANEIVFPAAILQPPFFDPDADPAVNYGGIGAVIGHEMTHGFDDQGRKYDGDGRLDNWWTDEDAKLFEAQAARLGAQYSAFEPQPGAHIKGDLTMGENIADLGGLLTALDAYHASLHGKPAPVIDGLTGDQRFFLGYAQIWREKIRDDYARQLIVADPHSPSKYRVIGTVRNVDAWYVAFAIKPTDPMYVAPDQRVRIW